MLSKQDKVRIEEDLVSILEKMKKNGLSKIEISNYADRFIRARKKRVSVDKGLTPLKGIMPGVVDRLNG